MYQRMTEYEFRLTLMAVLLGTATGVAYFLLRVWHFATNHAGVV